MGSSEIEKMTPTERLQTMESLWDALAQDAESVPAPGWHGKVIADRLERIRKGQASFLTVEQAKERLKAS